MKKWEIEKWGNGLLLLNLSNIYLAISSSWGSTMFHAKRVDKTGNISIQTLNPHQKIKAILAMLVRAIKHNLGHLL